MFSSGKPHVCDRPPVSRCEEVRLAIRHFAQLTKRIAKCRKRNPASRILLRAICVAHINAVRCGKEAAAAVCVGQSASRSVRQANRSASFRRQRPIPIGNRWPAASVPAFAVARSGGGRRQRHELVGGQARRRSSDLEGASPKRAAYSREKVERREKPQPVAIAATESSGLALSSRWRARSSR